MYRLPTTDLRQNFISRQRKSPNFAGLHLLGYRSVPERFNRSRISSDSRRWAFKNFLMLLFSTSSFLLLFSMPLFHFFSLTNRDFDVLIHWRTDENCWAVWDSTWWIPREKVFSLALIASIHAKAFFFSLRCLSVLYSLRTRNVLILCVISAAVWSCYNIHSAIKLWADRSSS